MKIYIDYILLINFLFDFLILFTVSRILKRKTKLKNLIMGSVIGALSIFLLFFKINTLTLFILKVLISILMILITFGYKDFIKNFFYLYFVSIILGGFLYFINNSFSYKIDGLIYINNGYSINLIFLLIISPIILYLYIKENKIKIKLSNIHNVEIKYKGKSYYYRAYLDTGNTLKDPYKNKPVNIIYDNRFKLDKFIYIPYNMMNENGLLKGFTVDEMIIDNEYIYKNVMIGLSNNKFKLEDCNMILNREFVNIST